MPLLLLVEDDARTATLVADFLRREGFEVEIEADGAVALQRVLDRPPDLLILDWMLPGLDGLTVCRRVRERWSGPVLMLTARGDEVDQIVGLEVGADDYLAKPVRPRLLLARIRALLRRTAETADRPGDRIEAGWLVIDRGRRQVLVGGAPVALTTAEFDLLWLLASHAGEPVGRERLFTELRGMPYDGLDRSMDMRVSQLRKRLMETDPQGRDPIRTVRGTGYQLVTG